MSIVQLILGVTCAAGTMLFMWQIATKASRYMIRQQPEPPGMSMLSESLEGVELSIPTTDGREIKAWHRGSGPAVVIVADPGLSGSAYTPLWRLLCGYGFRVISYEGRSISNGSIDSELLLSDLEQVLTTLHVKQPLLVGHGFGAYLCFLHQAKALKQGWTKARALVSVAGFAGGKREVPLPEFIHLFQQRASYLRHLSAFGDGASERSVAALRKLERGRLGSYLDQTWPQIEDVARLTQLSLPISIVASPSDEMVSAIHSQRIHKLLPHSFLQWIRDGAGHMLVWERPSAIVELVLQTDRPFAVAM